MKFTQNIQRETVAMLVVVQNLIVRRIIPTTDNIKGKKRKCAINLQVQNVLNKRNHDTEVSTEITFISNSNKM